jgi:hypothetical protein
MQLTSSVIASFTWSVLTSSECRLCYWALRFIFYFIFKFLDSFQLFFTFVILVHWILINWLGHHFKMASSRQWAHKVLSITYLIQFFKHLWRCIIVIGEQEHLISWRTRIALFSLHLCQVCVFPFIAKSECERVHGCCEEWIRSKNMNFQPLIHLAFILTKTRVPLSLAQHALLSIYCFPFVPCT